MIRSLITTAVIAGSLGIGVAQAQKEPDRNEQGARACIHKRLAELVAENNRNVTADPALTACASGLKSELKDKGKAECEITDYVGRIIRNENSKIYGVSGGPYKPDKTFITRCQKS
jgi:hypothetical protein